jgi:hypothetical protein
MFQKPAARLSSFLFADFYPEKIWQIFCDEALLDLLRYTLRIPRIKFVTVACVQGWVWTMCSQEDLLVSGAWDNTIKFWQVVGLYQRGLNIL